MTYSSRRTIFRAIKEVSRSSIEIIQIICSDLYGIKLKINSEYSQERNSWIVFNELFPVGSSIEPASPVGGNNLKDTGDFGSWALAGGCRSQGVCPSSWIFPVTPVSLSPLPGGHDVSMLSSPQYCSALSGSETIANGTWTGPSETMSQNKLLSRLFSGIDYIHNTSGHGY